MIERTDRILMIDVESTNDIDCPIVYDVGYQIFSLSEGVLVERSFVNLDVFNDAELMSSAYFLEKVPQYCADLASGKRVGKTWSGIKWQIAQDCKRYGVEFACAHNAAFDNRALNNTQRYETTSRYRYFLPYGIVWLDTLKMSRQILKNDHSYGEFCYENDYLTARGCRRYTAEIIYRWLSGKNDFEESHTGLEDVKIEIEILKYCLNIDPEIDGRLWKD